MLGVEDLGHEVLVLLDCAGQRLGARLPVGLAPRVGQEVAVRVPPERVLVFTADGRRR